MNTLPEIPFTPIHFSYDGATYDKMFRGGLTAYLKKQLPLNTLDDIKQLEALGFNFDKFMTRAAMDAIQQGLTTPSVGTPIQFLQGWLPGWVKMITAARKIDQIIGITAIGDFYDFEIVQGIAEQTAFATPYSDVGNVPLANVNTNFAYRNTVQFECGFRVGMREQGIAAKMRLDLAGNRRSSATLALEIARNRVGFYGYNAGNNLTYGYLNDPNLPGYQTVATGGTSGSKLWSAKNYLEIIADLLAGFQQIQTNSQDNVDPAEVPTTLNVPTNSVQYLKKTTDFPGVSVLKWLGENYPKCRVISAPELNGANGGANVFYLFADTVNDTSDDGQQTFIQMIPSKMQTLGVQQLVKGYEEDFANSTAGTMCKRPYAVYRGSGI